MQKAAARRERFLPYAYGRGELELRIVSCILDGEAAVPPDVGRRLLELDIPWTSGILTLEVGVTPSTTTRVLPASATADEVQILVKLHCPPTFLRSGRTSRIATFDAPCTVEFEIARADLAEAAYLQAYLVRTQPLEAAAGYGKVRGARLADSPSWELRIDRTREPRGEFLDLRYRRFSDDETIPPRDRRNLYRLELDPAAPVLLINADHERIAAVLDSKGTVGRYARLREVAFDSIAHSVWSQLFLYAARSYVELEEETLYSWQDAVLDGVLRDVFPEAASGADRRDRLVDEWGDLPGLMSRLDAALQQRNPLAAHLEKLLQEEDQE